MFKDDSLIKPYSSTLNIKRFLYLNYMVSEVLNTKASEERLQKNEIKWHSFL